jgi:hypothetical protein
LPSKSSLNQNRRNLKKFKLGQTIIKESSTFGDYTRLDIDGKEIKCFSYTLDKKTSFPTLDIKTSFPINSTFCEDICINYGDKPKCARIQYFDLNSPIKSENGIKILISFAYGRNFVNNQVFHQIVLDDFYPDKGKRKPVSKTDILINVVIHTEMFILFGFDYFV